MYLIVGPASGTGSVELSQNAWATFERQVPNVPFDYEDVRFEPLEGPCDAVAMAQACIGPGYTTNEHAKIILGSRFFAASADERMLTLLHETIHLRLSCGPLVDWTIRTRQLWRDMPLVRAPERYCQMLWIGHQRDQAATFRSPSLFRSCCTPSMNVTPARTSGSRCAPLSRRQRCCAISSSL